MTTASWLAWYGRLAVLLMPVVVCAGIGAFWAVRRKIYPSEFIATFTTSVATPALVFHTLLTSQLDGRLLWQVAGVGAIGLALAAMFAASLLHLARFPARALTPVATFPNAGNLGMPVSQLAFGEVGLAVSVAFFCMCTLIQNTIGVFWLARTKDKVGLSGGLWPVGVALACAAACGLRAADIQLPGPVIASARLVGSLAVPLMLLNLGFGLMTVSRGGMRVGAYVGFSRLVSGTAAATIIAWMFPLTPLVIGVLQLQLIMPVAVMMYVYTDRFTGYGQAAAGAVLVSTLMFVLLGPLALWWAGAALTVPAP
jgi:predicted permease